jgi:hypothetical protein
MKKGTCKKIRRACLCKGRNGKVKFVKRGRCK